MREVVGFNEYCKEKYLKEKEYKEQRGRNCRHSINPIGPGEEAKEESEAKKMRKTGSVVVIGISNGMDAVDPAVADAIKKEFEGWFEKWKSEHPDNIVK